MAIPFDVTKGQLYVFIKRPFIPFAQPPTSNIASSPHILSTDGGIAVEGHR